MALAFLNTFFAGIKALGKPVIYVARVFTDQTRLQILLPRSTANVPNTAWIFNQTGDAGSFYFGLTTVAAQEVEVLEIRMCFAAPLELRDPADEGFFLPGASTDPEFPFELAWGGSVVLRRGVIQCFGVEAHFRDGIEAREILLNITLRRQVRELGGYISSRRCKRVEKRIRLQLTAEEPLGIEIPTGAISQSAQPAMRRAQMQFVGEANVFRINYIDPAGRPQTRVVPTPRNLPE